MRFFALPRSSGQGRLRFLGAPNAVTAISRCSLCASNACIALSRRSRCAFTKIEDVRSSTYKMKRKICHKHVCFILELLKACPQKEGKKQGKSKQVHYHLLFYQGMLINLNQLNVSSNPTTSLVLYFEELNDRRYSCSENEVKNTLRITSADVP